MRTRVRVLRIAAALLLAILVWREANMPHGARKWANVGAKEAVYGLDDMAELAARLGSPVTHSREGNVIFIESFEHGMTRWTAGATGDGREAELTAQYVYTGSYSLVITPASAIPYTHDVSCLVAYPQRGGLGVEVAFTVPDKARYIRLDTAYYDGNELHYTQVRYDHVNHVLEYLGGGGGWQVIDSDVSLLVDPTLFHVIKYVIDVNKNLFVRAILDADEHDAINGSIRTVADTSNAHLKVWLWVQAQDSSQPKHYFDALIVTQNEPD